MSDLSGDGMVEQELHGINLSLSVLVMNAKNQWRAGQQESEVARVQEMGFTYALNPDSFEADSLTRTYETMD